MTSAAGGGTKTGSIETSCDAGLPPERLARLEGWPAFPLNDAGVVCFRVDTAAHRALEFRRGKRLCQRADRGAPPRVAIGGEAHEGTRAAADERPPARPASISSV